MPPDDLVRYLTVITAWLRLIRVDPRIPVQYLSADWPAIRGREVQYGLRDR